jgi:hypothetical protein
MKARKDCVVSLDILKHRRSIYVQLAAYVCVFCVLLQRVCQRADSEIRMIIVIILHKNTKELYSSALKLAAVC